MHEYQGGGASATRAWAPNIGSGGARTTDDTGRVLALDEATDQIAETNLLLLNTIGELRAWLDGTVGEIPEPGSASNTNTPKPSGRMYGLQERIRDTRQLAELLREQIQRLQSI